MKKALIGAGGSAREIKAQMCISDMICFVDDIFWKPNLDNILPLSKFNPSEFEVLITLGSSKDRLQISKKLPVNTKYFTFIHPTALILDDKNEIGEGTFIGAYSILTTNIKIGKHCLLNRSNHIGHDSICGNFLSMMPSSIISGNCIIGDNFYIGTNSSIKEKIKICESVTVGLNSGVVKNICTPGVYAGCPVKKIK